MKAECNRSDWVLLMLKTSCDQINKALLLFDKWRESGKREDLEELQKELEEWKTFPENRDLAIDSYCYQAGLQDREIECLAREIISGDFEFASYTAQKLLRQANVDSEEAVG